MTQDLFVVWIVSYLSFCLLALWAQKSEELGG